MENIPSGSWTTRELRDYIRKHTQQINIDLYQMYEEGKTPTKAVLREREKLIQLGTGKETRAGGIGLGLSNKRKSELIQQARAIRDFEAIDYESPTARRKYSSQIDKAYRKYSKRKSATGQPKLSKKAYVDFVETLGAVGDKVLQEFGYESISEEYKNSTGKQRTNFLQAMIKVHKELEGTGASGEDLIDALHNELQNF